ncbi:MAG: cation-translocating P-type ATPase, partial [Actinomycetota bacterium]
MRRPPTTPWPPPPWHALRVAETLAGVAGTVDGLTAAVAARRLASDGPNTVAPVRRDSPWAAFGEALVEPLPLLLVAVGVLSAVFGEARDAVAIFLVIGAVAGVEAVTELRASRAVAELARLTAPTARVRRDGQPVEVPAAAVVVGDLIELAPGDVVPADARVLAAQGLRVDESTLTGEAQPVDKAPAPVPPDTPLAERRSLLYAGTPVLAGAGRAVVVATGAATELGRIGGLVDTGREPPSPLARAMGELARVVLAVAVLASLAVPLVGVLAGRDWREMLLTGLTLAFATVPEELPILVTVLLAVAGRRLARSGVLLRRLRAGETLGAVTYLLTDKTGTLTVNRLTLQEVVGDRGQVLAAARAAVPDDAATSADPVARELARAAGQLDLPPPGREVAVVPFDPVDKLAARVRATPGGPAAAVLGAPEAVLDRCQPGPVPAELADRAADLAATGARVLAVARRRVPPPAAGDPAAARAGVLSDLEPVGLVAFTDPLRPGVPEAAATLYRAGVAVVVVTGDHPQTATAVARAAGLPPGPLLLGGAALAAVPDADLAARLVPGTVVARATPADKLRLVRVLQARGEVVAVTGDGVNDAPALRAADAGVAMGRRGTQLAAAAAAVVLTNDDFPSIATAVAAGRTVGAQLRRAVGFYLGAKLALVVVLLTALAAGAAPPFAPVHVVLLEVFMDLGASLAFVGEPAAPRAMQRPPHRSRGRSSGRAGARFLDARGVATILAVAAALTAATLPAYLLAARAGTLPQARAAAVLGWLAAHALVAWALRARPGLPPRANPAFPAWAAAATGT